MPLITVIGFPAAGKSTLCSQLASEFGHFLSPELDHPLADEVERLQQLDLLRAAGTWDYDEYQSIFLSVAVRNAEKLRLARRHHQTILLDRPVNDAVCVTEILNTAGRLRRYEQLRERFYSRLMVDESIGIYLDVDIATARARLVHRGNGYNSRDEYFALCGDTYLSWYRSRWKTFQVFDGRRSPCDIAATVTKYLRRFFNS